MRSFWPRLVAAASVMALAASGCGHDGLGPVLPVPSPSPTNSPSPVPSPTASPSPSPGPSPTPSDGQFVRVVLQVTALSAPEAASVGRPVQVTATVLVPNACTTFLEATAELTGERQVTVRATGLEEQGLVCAQVVSEVTTTLSFTPDEPGPYRVAAEQGDASATIEVTEQ